MSTFQLLGHDCPLGRYPAPVVPVGRRHDGKLVVAYWAEAGTTLEPIDEAAEFVRHSPELSARLGAFDPNEEHLFALDASDVEKYTRADENRFFLTLLAREDFSADNPFMRMTLANATKEPRAILLEMKRCLDSLPAYNPKLREAWFGKQRDELEKEIPGGAAAIGVPSTWQELAGLTKKEVYDIATFKPEAPELPKLVRELFCARDEELSQALESLRGNLDVSGRRAGTRDKRPWVIHGDSRSGKSHLARRLMLELPHDDEHLQFVLVLRQKQDAAVAMQMLLDELVHAYAGRANPPATGPSSFLAEARSAGLIARACGQIIQAMIGDHGIEHVLILIDDVDLLEDYADREQSGRVQRAALSAAIAELVRTAGVDIILTARSWYAEMHRECNELADLTPMTIEQLMLIYERQLSVFAPLRPCDPLSAAAIHKAAERTKGLPGLFLGYLHVALGEYRREPEWQQRDYDWYFEVMRRDYDKRRLRRPDQATRLEEDVLSGKSSIRIDSSDLFRSMTFDNHHVYGSSWSPTTLEIAPLVKEIILTQRAA